MNMKIITITLSGNNLGFNKYCPLMVSTHTSLISLLEGRIPDDGIPRFIS